MVYVVRYVARVAVGDHFDRIIDHGAEQSPTTYGHPPGHRELRAVQSDARPPDGGAAATGDGGVVFVAACGALAADSPGVAPVVSTAVISNATILEDRRRPARAGARSRVATSPER